MPASTRYAPLASALSSDVQLHLKDLEVYAAEEPPAGYSIDLEVRAVDEFANSLGLDRFHLLGYSGGGFISLAFAGAHPERLLSLALFEPAAVPGKLSADEAGLDARFREGLTGLSGPEFMRAFVGLQLRAGVEAPAPAGPPAPWMRNRPAGIAAMMAAIAEHQFDRERLRACRFPVFFGYGDLTGEQEELRASILARLLGDIQIRRFTGIHHFVAPEQIYTAEHVRALRDLWARAVEQRKPAVVRT
jgi:pimeloyl-ACP methyl ester carboxylesterase